MRAREVMGESKPRSGYQAFVLDQASRNQLANQFAPRFPEWIGHHITHQFGVKSTTALPPEAQVRVVGYAVDEAGLEALVVEINGSTARPDGKIYHVTWSLDRDAGFKPVASNDLVARGWQRLPSPININASPAFIGF